MLRHCKDEKDVQKVLGVLDSHPEFPVIDAYNDVLHTLCTFSGSFSTVAPRKLFSQMLRKGRVSSATICIIFPFLDTFEEVKALVEDAREYRLMNCSLANAMIDAFIRCGTKMTMKERRGCANWISAVISRLSKQSITPSRNQMYSLLNYYAAISHLEPAKVVYELMNKLTVREPDDEQKLEGLIKAWSQRPQARTERRFGSKLGRNLFVRMWNDLEEVSEHKGKKIKISRKEKQGSNFSTTNNEIDNGLNSKSSPSLSAHMTMTTLLALKGDVPYLRPLYSLFSERFPDAARSAAVVDILLIACVRNKFTPDAIKFASVLNPDKISPLSISLLFSSVYHLRLFHHTHLILDFLRSMFLNRDRECLPEGVKTKSDLYTLVEKELECMAVRFAQEDIIEDRRFLTIIPILPPPWCSRSEFTLKSCLKPDFDLEPYQKKGDAMWTSRHQFSETSRHHNQPSLKKLSSLTLKPNSERHLSPSTPDAAVSAAASLPSSLPSIPQHNDLDVSLSQQAPTLAKLVVGLKEKAHSTPNHIFVLHQIPTGFRSETGATFADLDDFLNMVRSKVNCTTLGCRIHHG